MRTYPDMTVLQRGHSRGLSLIELLVAAAIGIIASLAIFQVFAVFEGQKRTTTSGGEAQTSGTLALYSIERDARQGGYGFNTPDLVGCALQGWDQQVSAALAPSTLAPALITQGAGSTPGVAGAPDTLTVAYGNGDALPAPVAVLVGSIAGDTFVRTVNALYGFQPGEHVVIAEAGKPCTLAQVNQIPPATGDNTRLNLQAGTYVDPNTGATLNTRYNNPAGLGTAYAALNGKVYNIGPTPTIKVFSVQNSQLLSQVLGAAAATPMFDNIVQLQAQYGKDLDNDGVVDAFDEVTPVSSAQWAAVLALRISVVARSGLYEKDEVSPATIRLWADSATPPTTTGPVWTLTADERHYRYKVFQTVIPLRNMLWRPY